MAKDVFITKDFLLLTKTARELYHRYAAPLPIIDYHCHLPPADLARDRRWANLTQAWLTGDHYKWRALRANGVLERCITGDAPDREKFQQWAATVPLTLRNPLYHWTHLELKRPFGISDRLLNPATAQGIWDECNAKLATPEFSARGILQQMNVQLVCTTDDPVDTLEHHQAVARDPSCTLQMLPTFRPDKAMAVEVPQTFNVWVDRLAAACNLDIRTFDGFLTALRQRHAFFHQCGCRLSDHGLETVPAADYTGRGVTALFRKLRGGATLTPQAAAQFKTALLHEFGVLDHEMGWTMQLHLGVLRNNNTRMCERIGPDAGYDSIGSFDHGRPLAHFLDRLDREERLPKTILYNGNPADNELLAAMTGNFQDSRIPGKVQFGSAWWFLDQRDGMERQLDALSNLGLLGRFVGMLTDSRSFLSYTRHEYFRRILCNKLGREVEDGLLPNDLRLLGGLVQDVGYNNARRYFGFHLPR